MILNKYYKKINLLLIQIMFTEVFRETLIIKADVQHMNILYLQKYLKYY
jgi:hypothetical protein